MTGIQLADCLSRLNAIRDQCDILTQELARLVPSDEMGRRGGQQTAKRGAAYYRELAGKRKVRAGGRPKK